MILNEVGMPDPTGKSGSTNPEDYRIRYFKTSLDDIDGLAQLEVIETDILKGEKLRVSKDTFTFQDQFYVVICYTEKRD